MNDILLKPCPFCGENQNLGIEQTDPDKWRIACEKCGTISGIWHTKKECIEFWNTRINIEK